MHLEGFLSPDIARAEHVEANTGDDRRQPSAEILDLVHLGPAHPHPGVLDCIVGFGERAQHPIGDRPQVGPLLLEALRQPVLLVHCTHPRRKGHHNDPSAHHMKENTDVYKGC